MGPSSTTIVGLKRSLHCLLGSLRKVEPRMLSGIAPPVKIGPIQRQFRALWRAIVSSSRGVLFLPLRVPFFEAHWLIRHPFFDDAHRF